MCLCTPLVDMLPLQEGGLNGIFLMHTVFLCTLICQTYKVNIQTILNDCESNIACNITQGVLVVFQSVLHCTLKCCGTVMQTPPDWEWVGVNVTGIATFKLKGATRGHMQKIPEQVQALATLLYHSDHFEQIVDEQPRNLSFEAVELFLLPPTSQSLSLSQLNW